MGKTRSSLIALACTALVACNGENDKALGAGGTSELRDGVWFGFIVDAKSGAPINFFTDATDSNGDAVVNAVDDDASSNQIWAVADGNIVSAQPCGRDGVAGTVGAQAGCFKMTGLPVGVDVPVFARHSDYHPFASSIKIDPFAEGGGGVGGSANDNYAPYGGVDNTTINVGSGGGQGNAVVLSRPSINANVRLFPTGLNYDVTITVETEGELIGEGIAVRCAPNPASAEDYFDVVGDVEWRIAEYIDEDGNFDSIFLQPNALGGGVVSGTTNAERSQVVIPGSELTKGLYYECYAHGEDTIGGQVVYYTGGSGFTPGVSSPFVTLGADASNNGDLRVVWNNFADSDRALGGVDEDAVLIFNRPVEIVPGTEDCQTASVTVGNSGDDGATSATVANVDDPVDMAAAESVNVSLDSTGTVMTVSAVLETDSADDTDIFMNFGGIYVTSTDVINSVQIWEIGGNGTNHQIEELGLSCSSIGTSTVYSDLHSGNLGTGTVSVRLTGPDW